MSEHKFVAKTPVDTDGISAYLATAEDKHHRAAMANWDKKPGLHKLEKTKSFSAISARDIGHIILATVKPPRLNL